MFRLFLYESNRRCLISVRPRPPLTDIFEDVRSGRPELRGGVRAVRGISSLQTIFYCISSRIQSGEKRCVNR